MKFCVFLLAALVTVGSPGWGLAQAPIQGFYQGKTIEIIVSSGAGDSYDTLSRLVGAHIGKHLSGNPAVVVKNMTGAGGITAANYLYNLAPKNGLSMGMLDQSIYETQLFQTGGLQADVTRFNWIGRVISNNSVLFAWRTAQVKKIEDALTKELIVSASGRSSLIRWTVLKRLLGLKFNLITGHQGSSEGILAMERGEVDGLSLPWTIFRVAHADWLWNKQVNLLLQSGLDRAADLPDVPRVVDLARDGEQRDLLELFSQSEKVGRSLVSPPGQPPERVSELRAAYSATLRDPEFVSAAAAQQLVLDPLTGEELQAVIQKAFEYGADTVAKAKALTKLD